MILKKCNICEKYKSITEFHKRSSTKSSVGPYCKPCNSARAAKWNKDNPEKACINSMKWSKANSEIVRKNFTVWKIKNLNHCKSYAKNYEKKWREENRDKVRTKDAKHHAEKLQRTPKWLTKEQYKEIEKFYTLAKELQQFVDESLEVDHIIPLRGKNVSGLHVPWNLQILTKSENAKKGNKI